MKMTGLAHDTARRFAAMVAISKCVCLPEKPSLLDVGGYPCNLARLLKDAHPGATALTIDQIDAQLDDYRVADGAELPFADGEFDAVFTADAFEHIAPGRRAAFIAELVRVSRGPVILGAPFDQPAVRIIESQLNDAHIVLTGKEHPWLHEHVAYGLPNLRETVGLFPDDRIVALVRSAPLLDWALWNWLQMAHELSESMDESWNAMDEALRNLDERAAGDGEGRDFEIVGAEGERGFTPYRWILVAQPKDQAHMNPPAQFPEPSDSEGGTCVAYSAMLRAVIESAVRPPQSGDSPAAEINERLKLALAGAEQQAADLQRELDNQDSRTRSGFLRRWRK